jgi:predicted Zn-dependent protease
MVFSRSAGSSKGGLFRNMPNYAMMMRPRQDFNRQPRGALTYSMTGDLVTKLTRMLDAGRDNALLRFSLGSEFLKAGKPELAAEHLRAAVTHDPAYSAAWKLLGRALTESGRPADALAAYREGIRVAESKGDKQAAKEMTVFARRLEKQLPSAPQ